MNEHTPNDKNIQETCNESNCDCSTNLPRREFIAIAGMASAGAILGSQTQKAMAGPFENENVYLQTIPTDKKLSPEWVKSLFARGEKETYSDKKALQHIGMPVGGLFAGTVYLSGDGQLWLWDIFNADQEGIQPRIVQYAGEKIRTRNGANYIEPATPKNTLKKTFFGPPSMAGKNYVNPVQPNKSQLVTFDLHIGEKRWSLSQYDFSNVTFDGRYPIGNTSFQDKSCPIDVALKAFSPFIPLNVDDSSLPATIMEYTLTNKSATPQTVSIEGLLYNPVCQESRTKHAGLLLTQAFQGKQDGLTRIECSAKPFPRIRRSNRPDFLFENFEETTYKDWTVKGEAFGAGPILKTDIPKHQGEVGGKGERVLNSHASSQGNTTTERDAKVGSLTSKPFTIARRYIRFQIGGGSHKGKTCVNLLIGGKVIASATGRNSNKMLPAEFNVHKYDGKEATLQIVDNATGGWGNIGIDEIVFTDTALSTSKLEEQRDFGTFTLALVEAQTGDTATVPKAAQEVPFSETPTPDNSAMSSIRRTVTLQPGESKAIPYIVAWHFPNFYARGVGHKRVGHSYATRFDSSTLVAKYIADNYNRLAGETKCWVETWYDSTLPYWFLDRTMANTSILATTTCYRFADGRFWAWEGVGCCNGTCTHVWHYAQALGRIFPQIEREHREKIDFGIALHKDGGIGMRAGLTGANGPAHDGQCGRILGALREHQMAKDNGFLKRTWPNIKKAVQYLIQKDSNADGMIEGAQPNTLDADWFGKISFLASLYLAALKAGEAMAQEMGDEPFAATCREIAKRGEQSILETYNGEFFIQLEEDNRKKEIGIGPGCYIDQIFGQTWAHWTGLGQVFDREKQLSALRALWKYNFVPDVGPFRKKFPRGRWYAMEGDAGLLMSTWPKGGQNPDFKKHWQYMYFNECMSGFEWQAAAHMIFEGIDQPDILQNGLAVSRAIHDRYSANLRNPYNEIECSDHYSRAMASFGAYQAACGFSCHGPKGELGFAPRWNQEEFRCAFTTAEGWGTFSQKKEEATFIASIELQWGKLSLKKLSLVVPKHIHPKQVVAELSGKPVPAKLNISDTGISIHFENETIVTESETLHVTIR